MPLFEVTIDNKTEIIYSKKSNLSFKPKNCKSIFVRSFKYEYSHPLIPPVILNLRGKKILNDEKGTILHPNTTLDDIIWDKPILQTKNENVFEYFLFQSKSSNSTYTVVKKDNGIKITYTCDCPGVWRIRDKNEGCIHIKTIKNQEC